MIFIIYMYLLSLANIDFDKAVAIVAQAGSRLCRLGMGCGSAKEAAAVPPFKATEAQLVQTAAQGRVPASVSGKRHAAARRKRLALAEILKRFDATQQGTLNKEEVKNFAAAALERDVTDEEVALAPNCLI